MDVRNRSKETPDGLAAKTIDVRLLREIEHGLDGFLFEVEAGKELFSVAHPARGY